MTVQCGNANGFRDKPQFATISTIRVSKIQHCEIRTDGGRAFFSVQFYTKVQF